MMESDQIDERWPLASGLWVRGVGAGYRLVETAAGEAAYAGLAAADLARLAGARLEQATDAVFPPEFAYSPVSGASLPAAPPASAQNWVPPHGQKNVAAGERPGVRGLRVTPQALRVSAIPRAEGGDGDAALPLPPAGNYEFLVSRYGTRGGELLALDPVAGALYLWLAESALWMALADAGGGFLAETALKREDWRCEVAGQGEDSLIFLPTAAGLACLRPRALALSFEVAYIGSGAVIGAPLHWGGAIWAPQRRANGTLVLQAAELSGAVGAAIDVATDDPLAGLGRFAPPVGNERQLIWPGDGGQLVLSRTPDGGMQADWLAWPGGVTPAFEFGCPFMPTSGGFWQLCWDAGRDTYVYLQLGRTQAERHEALAPRLSTGRINYRFGARMKLPPWQEPEHGDDGAGTVVLPLLESAVDAAVVGVEVESSRGLNELLGSRERLHATLLVQADNHADLRLLRFYAAQPWAGRVFMHDGLLWFYHPEASRIEGWRLEV
ncbi:hypothetical protein GRF61_19980 [Azoarcus sp. TTM-91]|uniref:hypothetical protein n=1 Tax=Azoarcus sp. TTM-91 TaxID=2691581 RepID=UPI00145D5ECC|nr:hypothetical protein [Azoarcus sp. TTM-91]NMG36736.1 hypothetical protein [Azoarcus sp. TTM-91]